MCGLFGLVVKNTPISGLRQGTIAKPVTKISDVLEYGLDHNDRNRGRDGYGWAAWFKTPPAGRKSQFIYDKHITEFRGLSVADKCLLDQSSVIIGHARKMTQGARELAATHPICANSILLTHNGTVSSWREQSIKMLGTSDFVSDTEFIANALSIKGTEVLGTIQGVISLVYFDIDTNTLNIYKHKERPLYILETPTLIAWSSTPPAIYEALWYTGLATDEELKNIKPVESEKLYTLNLDKLSEGFSTVVDIPHAVIPVVSYTTARSYTGYYPSSYEDTSCDIESPWQPKKKEVGMANTPPKDGNVKVVTGTATDIKKAGSTGLYIDDMVALTPPVFEHHTVKGEMTVYGFAQTIPDIGLDVSDTHPRYTSNMVHTDVWTTSRPLLRKINSHLKLYGTKNPLIPLCEFINNGDNTLCVLTAAVIGVLDNPHFNDPSDEGVQLDRGSLVPLVRYSTAAKPEFYERLSSLIRDYSDALKDIRFESSTQTRTELRNKSPLTHVYMTSIACKQFAEMLRSKTTVGVEKTMFKNFDHIMHEGYAIWFPFHLEAF